MAIDRFNTNEVRLIIWVKRGDLEHWISGGYLEPSYLEDAACGKRYMWSRNDIYELAAFKALVDSGLKPIDAHELLEASVNDEIKNQVDERIKGIFG